MTKEKNGSGKLIVSLVIVAVVCFAAGYLGSSLTGASVASPGAEEKAVSFINDNMLPDGVTASIVNSTYESGMSVIFVRISDGNQSADYKFFSSPDGRYLFTYEPIDTDFVPEPQNTGAACDSVQKAGSAQLEAFVVSYCPYGLQMQRILAEVADILGDSVTVRYIGSVQDGEIYAMHGDVEAQENLRQICLREETDKYWDYVKCFMRETDTAGCLAEAGVDTEELDACMSDPARGIAYAEVDFALQAQHSVTGSPTLIMNGERASEFAFGASREDQLESFGVVWGRSAEAVKDMLCCGFNAPPAVCSQELLKDNAATGASLSYSGQGSGSC